MKWCQYVPCSGAFPAKPGKRYCSRRCKEKAKVRRNRTPEKSRDLWLRAQYGITLEEFNAASAERGGRCDICGAVPEKGLCVDHDHDTGAIRGYLCHTCNAGIRLLGDRPEGVEQALRYLRTHYHDSA